MIPREIIEEAVKGGWIPQGMEHTPELRTYYDILRNVYFAEQVIALDPTFWVALGKICGWGQEILFKKGCLCEKGGHGADVFEWMLKAQGFYDLILTGQPTEPFWKELLTPLSE